MNTEPSHVTQLIRRMAEGDGAARDELWPVIYDELRALAHGQMSPADRRWTLQPTAVVHEAWLRFDRMEDFRFDERAQFFLLAGKVMRSVLVDAARARNAQKRGDGRRVELTLSGEASEGSAVDLAALDDALERLEARDPDLAQLVELRFFSGLSHRQCAEALGQSVRTIERRWQLARVWLHGELS